MLAQGKRGGPVSPRCLLEDPQSFGGPPGLHGDPGPGLGEGRGERGPDLRSTRRLSEAAQGRPEAALLGFDQGEVVRALRAPPRADPGIGEQPVIDAGGIDQPPAVLQQNTAVEVQVQGGRAGDEHRRGRQVLPGRPEPAKLHTDGGAAHQQVRERSGEMVAAGDPAGLIQQAERHGVVEPGPLGPCQRPQSQGQRLRLTCLLRLGHQSLGYRPELVRVGRNVLVCPSGTYHERAWGL